MMTWILSIILSIWISYKDWWHTLALISGVIHDEYDELQPYLQVEREFKDLKNLAMGNNLCYLNLEIEVEISLEKFS